MRIPFNKPYLKNKEIKEFAEKLKEYIKHVCIKHVCVYPPQTSINLLNEIDRLLKEQFGVEDEK